MPLVKNISFCEMETIAHYLVFCLCAWMSTSLPLCLCAFWWCTEWHCDRILHSDLTIVAKHPLTLTKCMKLLILRFFSFCFFLSNCKKVRQITSLSRIPESQIKTSASRNLITCCCITWFNCCLQWWWGKGIICQTARQLEWSSKQHTPCPVITCYKTAQAQHENDSIYIKCRDSCAEQVFFLNKLYNALMAKHNKNMLPCIIATLRDCFLFYM